MVRLHGVLLGAPAGLAGSTLWHRSVRRPRPRRGRDCPTIPTRQQQPDGERTSIRHGGQSAAGALSRRQRQGRTTAARRRFVRIARAPPLRDRRSGDRTNAPARAGVGGSRGAVDLNSRGERLLDGVLVVDLSDEESGDRACRVQPAAASRWVEDSETTTHTRPSPVDDATGRLLRERYRQEGPKPCGHNRHDGFHPGTGRTSSRREERGLAGRWTKHPFINSERVLRCSRPSSRRRPEASAAPRFAPDSSRLRRSHRATTAEDLQTELPTPWVPSAARFGAETPQRPRSAPYIASAPCMLA